ncbi:MAG: GH3 auxin-responsive promoter family protein, partial [Rudanella sp.]|nr:GH3 auxin-responsive promoter family protein [Rudanella sp.]
MGIRSVLSKPLARWVVQRQQEWMYQPGAAQQRVFNRLMAGVRQTQFGADHHLGEVQTMAEFRQAVPVRDYEDLK